MYHTAHVKSWELDISGYLLMRSGQFWGGVFNWNLEFFFIPKPAKLCLMLQVKGFLSNSGETNRPGCAFVLETPPLSSLILALKGRQSLLENLPYCKCKEASGCS